MMRLSQSIPNAVSIKIARRRQVDSYRAILTVLTFLIVPLVGFRAEAQAPAQISLQGYLEDGGSAVNTPQTIEVSLHTAISGGTQVFVESHAGVAVTDGVYTILLGSINDLGVVDFNQDLWLQTEVGGTTLSPRTKLVGSPAAMTLIAPATVSGDATGVAVLTSTNTATTGTSDGLSGTTVSTTNGAAGVRGYASASSGQVIGVDGLTESENGVGVYGTANALTGQNQGVRGETNSPTGIGVYGVAFVPSGDNYGVFGQSNSAEGTGVYGLGLSTSGINYGVRGETVSSSTSAAGVRGKASATSGLVFGVEGLTDSQDGIAVFGRGTATTGTNFGVRGESVSNDGIGVFGWAQMTSGTNYGVYGQSSSPTGWAGYFTGGKGLHVDGSESEIFNNSDGTTFHLFLKEQESGDFARLRMRNESNANYWDIAAGGASNNDLNFFRLGVGDVMMLRATGDPLLMLNGARLTSGGTWTNSSSARLKREFTDIDPAVILETLRRMSISEWSYTAEPGVRHLGPTSEEFREAFGLGSDNGGIGTVDADGVALVGIQALYDLVESQRVLLEAQQDRLDALEAAVAHLRMR